MLSKRSALADAESAWSQVVRDARRRHPDFCDLTVSNPTQVGLAAPWAQVQAVLANNLCMDYQPEPFGWLPAREAVSAYLQQRVPAERVVLAASTSELYSWLFQLLCDPGDQVLVPTPSYPLFDCLAQLQAVQTVAFPWIWTAGTWWLDRDALLGLVSPRCKALVLVSPNNPTGAVLQGSDLAFVSQLCQQHGMALVVDEVFADFVPAWPADAIHTCAGHAECLTFVLSGLSKVALLPHLKLGWMAVSGPPALLEPALERLAWIADTYLSVATPIQHALPELLALAPHMRQPLQERVAAHRKLLTEALRGTAASLLPADGGWLAIVRLPEPADHELERSVQLLESTGVLVQPGWLYDLPFGDSFVVSLLPEPQTFSAGVQRLAAWVERTMPA